MNGLIGINVRIVPHFYISLEALLQAAYSREYSDYKQFEGEGKILGVYGGETRKQYIAELRPISAFNIIYQF